MENLRYNFRGIIAPVFTPFNSKKMLNLEIIPKYATYLKDSGIEGVLVNGTTGEGTSMSVEERQSVAAAWAEAVKSTKQHLMIQVGGAPLPDVLQLAKHAESIKASAILCLPELYFKPETPKQLISYLKIVASAAPNTPLLYYHIPMFTNVNIHMAEFLESIGSNLPTFVGIKFTSNNLVEGVQALNACSKRYVIFLGCDQLMSAACVLGMDSFIATSVNIFPKTALAIVRAASTSKPNREAQEQLSEMVQAISKHGNWVETMKVAMSLETKIDVGPVRAPLKPLTPKAQDIMKADLEQLQRWSFTPKSPK